MVALLLYLGLGALLDGFVIWLCVLVLMVCC